MTISKVASCEIYKIVVAHTGGIYDLHGNPLDWSRTEYNQMACDKLYDR